jgi:hypothetical protein
MSEEQYVDLTGCNDGPIDVVEGGDFVGLYESIIVFSEKEAEIVYSHVSIEGGIDDFRENVELFEEEDEYLFW